MKKEEGFLLIEIIISAFAILTVLTAIYGCYNTSIVLMINHKLREEAYILAQKELLSDSNKSSLNLKGKFWVKRSIKNIDSLNNISIVTVEILNKSKTKVYVNLRKYK